MQYHEDTRAAAEEVKQFAHPMTVNYICARRTVKPAPKKRLYGEKSISLMGSIVGAGLAVVSILGLFILVGPK
jgi:hypothetical protein